MKLHNIDNIIIIISICSQPQIILHKVKNVLEEGKNENFILSWNSTSFSHSFRSFLYSSHHKCEREGWRIVKEFLQLFMHSPCYKLSIHEACLTNNRSLCSAFSQYIVIFNLSPVIFRHRLVHTVSFHSFVSPSLLSIVVIFVAA